MAKLFFYTFHRSRRVSACRRLASGRKKTRSRRAMEVAMTTTIGAAVVKVIARPKAQRIEVCIERAYWWKCFSIKIENGVLPEKYRGDAQIEAAYKLVLAQHHKWQNMESLRKLGDTSQGESVCQEK